jgi:uncharacterized protein YbcV (DUF1398 family)
MSAREKLLKAASLMSDLADKVEHQIDLEENINKLKDAGVISTVDEIKNQTQKYASFDKETMDQTTELLIDSAARLTEKSASFGKPVINQSSNSSSDRYSGWHDRIMNLNK